MRLCKNEKITYYDPNGKVLVPLVNDRDDTASVDTDLFPGRLGHVEMLKRRIAPTSIVARKSEVGRTEIGGGDCNGSSFNTPSGVRMVITHDSVTLST